ncbi:hypothetical protein [Fervidobacterium sp.]
MALNRRTVILLILAIAIWGVAIVVLYINYGPKKSTPTSSANTTSSQTMNEQASQAGSVNVPPPTAPIGQSSTNVAGPTTTGAPVVADLPSLANLSITELASMVESKISIKNVFEPYFVDLASLLEGVSGSLESQGSSTFIEDITSDSRQYHGYLEIRDGSVRITKLYLTLNGETKAWLSEELIDGKYKVVYVSSKFLVVLDTSDGRIKKISVMQK